MQANDCSADIDGGLVKINISPSLADAKSNDILFAPVDKQVHRQEEGAEQSQTAGKVPPKKHDVDYEGCQLGGNDPPDTPKSAFSSDMEENLFSPLAPQKILTEDSVSTGLNASLDLSKDASMIVNTGTSVEKQIVDNKNSASESFSIVENLIREEDDCGVIEKEEIDNIKSLSSPTCETEPDIGSISIATPIGSSILSPPKMSRHTQIHRDPNLLIKNATCTIKSSTPEGEMVMKESIAHNLLSTTDISPIRKASISNLICTQSSGEHSEAPSSLLGCNFLSNGENLLDSVTKQSDKQLHKGHQVDTRDSPVSGNSLKVNSREVNNKESGRNTEMNTADIISNFKLEKKYFKNYNDDDNSSGDANSLVSEYGSDIGDIKIRLDEVYAMAAVEEDENEEINNSISTNQDGKCNTKSDVKLAHLQHLQNDLQISFGDEDQDKENCENHSTPATSSKLVLNSDTIEKQNRAANGNNSSRGKCYSVSSKTNSPASPLQNDSNLSTTPTTPIATVSAAFRRIGNGMSNMARGSKSPSNSDPILNAGIFDLSNSQKSKRIQLSPRGESFNDRGENSIESNTSSPRGLIQNARAQISSPIHHARSGFLSFVSESGLPPCANMLRINDSPPTSPLLLPKRSQFKSHSTGHTPRLRFKSQSWEVRSNRICDNECDRMTDIDLNMDRRKATQHNPGSNLFSGLSAASTNTAFRNNGSVLIRGKQPYQEAINSSRSHQLIHSLDLSVTEKIEAPTRENANPSILSQSTQRVDDLEKEDALDILALLVERSVAFHEKTDQLSEEAEEDESAIECTRQGNKSHPSQFQNDGSPSVANENMARNITVECLDTNPSLSLSDIQDSIKDFRVISKNYSDGTMAVDHATRMGALDELQRSYTYALEMKRAALSASTWLRAIGRSSKNDHNSAAEFSTDENISTATIDGVAPDQNSIHEYSTAFNINESLIDERTKMSPSSLKLALQSDQLLIIAKDKLNKRLDHELSLCRAEIGRLKSMSRSEAVFISQNKSILDEDDDDESSVSLKDECLGPLETESEMSFHDVKDDKDSNVSREHSTSQALAGTAEREREIVSLKIELSKANEKLKLMENKLEGLHQQHENGKHSSCINQPVSQTQLLADNESKEQESCDEKTEEVAFFTQRCEDDQCDLSSKPCIDLTPSSSLDNHTDAVEKANKADIKKDDVKQDEKMINVRMLDGENFVTEWNKLGPLPPPPDHDLHSPIVTVLLSQWTDDCSTRDSLISWMEKLIGGVDPDNVPPLKLSSLDHQVRDGFIMHVFPLLLRRSDLYLELTSRAQRRTSYDIIATVKSPQSVDIDSTPLKHNDGINKLTGSNLRNHVSGSHMMAFKASGGINAVHNSSFSQGTGHSDGMERGSVTHSSITEYISNQIGTSSHLEQRVPSVDTKVAGDFSTSGNSRSDSSTQKIPQQPSIMAGAINAVGGLLSRRKLHQFPHLSHKFNYFEEDKLDGSLKQSHLPNSLQTKFENVCPDLPKSSMIENEEEDQPYHRVVSAPPGRIGMTFVQYRGHAIVSDVYQNSPLNGWVFPSDILIAIDEVPVSGKRVLDIVKLLNARKERQRALRVISSHASIN